MAGRYRYVVITAALTALLLGLYATDRAVLRAKRNAAAAGLPAVPLRVGPWQGRDIPVSTEEAALLPRSRVLMRRYLPPGAPAGRAVDLAVVSATDLSAFHNPESCYRASGWAVVRKQQESLRLHPDRPPLAAESLLVERGGYRLYVLYWYADLHGGMAAMERAHRSRLGVLKSALHPGGGGPAAFFRLTTLAHEGEQRALARCSRFLRLLAHAAESSSHGKEEGSE
ncbi:MAG: EpsI family protein [Armatimonadetes bacterium]|jgi:EpsI family protein|nr:EpsI family protein [Armatimonadota bacterium]